MSTKPTTTIILTLPDTADESKTGTLRCSAAISPARASVLLLRLLAEPRREKWGFHCTRSFHTLGRQFTIPFFNVVGLHVCRPHMRIATDFALAIRAVVYAIFQCFGADLLDVYEAAGLLNDLPGVEILKLVNRMSNAASIGGYENQTKAISYRMPSICRGITPLFNQSARLCLRDKRTRGQPVSRAPQQRGNPAGSVRYSVYVRFVMRWIPVHDANSINSRVTSPNPTA